MNVLFFYDLFMVAFPKSCSFLSLQRISQLCENKKKLLVLKCNFSIVSNSTYPSLDPLHIKGQTALFVRFNEGFAFIIICPLDFYDNKVKRQVKIYFSCKYKCKVHTIFMFFFVFVYVNLIALH